MEKGLTNFIQENKLSPFNRTRTSVRASNNTIFKTKDAKSVHNRVLNGIAKNFVFPDTTNLLSYFSLTTSEETIRKRQEFFQSIDKGTASSFLSEAVLKKGGWKPPYSTLVVTEDEKTFVQLQKMNCPVKILLTEQDVMELADADIVQVIDCEHYTRALERLPQSVFLKNVDEAYLERHVELLSKWESIIQIMKKNNLDNYTSEIVNHAHALLPLLTKENPEKITRERVENALEIIKEEISARVVEMSVSGSSLIEVISNGVIPEELKLVVIKAIRKTGLPQELFLQSIPVAIDEAELTSVLRKQDINEFLVIAQKIKAASKSLMMLPRKLKQLEERLLLHDFSAGIVTWMKHKENLPQIGNDLILNGTKNLFLENPQPVSFRLNEQNKCSILTGANSGGKTTLLEHILQIISCQQLGLPLSGEATAPLFSEVYYFAKNKGSMNKGAFETLLSQMAGITPGKQTLILADEIEAVTEPGVAGKMISATAEYFINKGCLLVIATHLGHEIVSQIPVRARVDGIMAQGLSAENELIVDHNPVLGKLAHSTPELIIERMVKTNGGEYFEFLHSSIQGNRKE